MKTFVKKQNGVITAFVALMLASILSLGTLVLEAGRYQAAKTQLQEANISASTSMIAAYDTQFYERYGLLSIDTEFFNEERYIDYINFNSDLASEVMGNNVTRMYSIDSTELMGLYNLTSPPILKRQILARAKYHIVPEQSAFNAYNYTSVLGDIQNKCEYIIEKLSPVANGYADIGSLSDIDGEVVAALRALNIAYADYKKYDENCDITISSNDAALLPTRTGAVESIIPPEDSASIEAMMNDVVTVLGNSGNILKSSSNVVNEINVSIDISAISEIPNNFSTIDNPNIAAITQSSATKLIAFLNSVDAAIAALMMDGDGNMLLNAYISKYFSERTVSVKEYNGPIKGTHQSGVDNSTFSAACVEYIFGEDVSEKVNQEKAFDYVYAIRFINNLYAVMANSTTFYNNNCYSVAAHIAWANYETLTDLQLMTMYYIPVPLYKTSMILDIASPSVVATAFSDSSIISRMQMLGYSDGTHIEIKGNEQYSYKDCLSVALWLVPNSKKLMRVADIIQLEMRYRQKNVTKEPVTFLMSEQNTFCRVKCTVKLNSILPVISLDSEHGLDEIAFASVKYAGY